YSVGVGGTSAAGMCLRLQAGVPDRSRLGPIPTCLAAPPEATRSTLKIQARGVLFYAGSSVPVRQRTVSPLGPACQHPRRRQPVTRIQHPARVSSAGKRYARLRAGGSTYRPLLNSITCHDPI